MRGHRWSKILAIALSFYFSTGMIFSSSSKADSSSINFDNLDPVSTSLIAYKRVNDFIDLQATALVKPVFYISPTVGQRDTKLVLTGMERAATLWSQFVAPDKLNVVLHTELDSEWADERQITLTGEWVQKDQLPSIRMKKYGCNIGGMYLPGVLLFCVKNYSIQEGSSEYYAEAHKFAHEYTHFMEMNYKNWMAHARGKGVGTRNPCWIEEGFATFYGFAVGSNSVDPTGRLRREFTSNLTYNYDRNRKNPNGTLINLLKQGNVSETKRLFGLMENTPFPCDDTETAYAVGSIAAEALVAVKGQEGMNNFYKASARTGDWKASFQEAFGISVDSFYEKLTPYLASQFNPANFKYETATLSPTPSSAPSSTLSPSPTNSPSPGAPEIMSTPRVTTKKTTITCMKGKTIKRVSAINPKCPSGYKKK